MRRPRPTVRPAHEEGIADPALKLQQQAPVQGRPAATPEPVRQEPGEDRVLPYERPVLVHPRCAQPRKDSLAGSGRQVTGSCHA